MPCPFVPSGHFPTLWGITLAELSQLDRNSPAACIIFSFYRATAKKHGLFLSLALAFLRKNCYNKRM